MKSTTMTSIFKSASNSSSLFNLFMILNCYADRLLVLFINGLAEGVAMRIVSGETLSVEYWLASRETCRLSRRGCRYAISICSKNSLRFSHSSFVSSNRTASAPWTTLAMTTLCNNFLVQSHVKLSTLWK